MEWRNAIFCLGMLSIATYGYAQNDIEFEEASDRLATAIDSGSVAAVRRLLDEGVSPNTLVYDMTPLSWAIWEEAYYVVQLLIDRGADVNLPDSDGSTPLMSAANQSNEQIVDLLLHKGADINAVELTYGMSALQSACESGDEAIVDKLLSAGADWQHVDRYGGNCLEEAACYGHKAIVQKLRAKGVTTRWSLHVAAGIGDLAEVKKQLAAGTNVHAPNGEWGNTPVMFAIGGGQLEIAKLLVEKGAKLDTKNVIGGGPLHMAAGADQLDLVRWIIQQGVDVNAKDTDGSTPLDWASGDEVIELLETLGGEYGEYEYEEEK